MFGLAEENKLTFFSVSGVWAPFPHPRTWRTVESVPVRRSEGPKTGDDREERDFLRGPSSRQRVPLHLHPHAPGPHESWRSSQNQKVWIPVCGGCAGPPLFYQTTAFFLLTVQQKSAVMNRLLYLCKEPRHLWTIQKCMKLHKRIKTKLLLLTFYRVEFAEAAEGLNPLSCKV